MTKDEMLKKIAELNGEIESLKESVRTANSEMRKFQSDANRHATDFDYVQQKLTAIRTVVTAALRVDHGVGVISVSPYLHGDTLITDNDCREVRLLRHIHELSQYRPPF